jgi:hypothetical protein
MEISAKLTKNAEKADKFRLKKNNLTLEMEPEVETTFTLTAALKKFKVGKDENIVEGTGNPWATLKITSFDETAFEEFLGMELGDEVIITIEPVNKIECTERVNMNTGASRRC